MNNDRRKSLEKASALIDEARSIIETVRDEEQEAYDNMPEGLQSGDKGDQAQSAISALEDAVNDCESITDKISEATGA